MKYFSVLFLFLHILFLSSCITASANDNLDSNLETNASAGGTNDMVFKYVTSVPISSNSSDADSKLELDTASSTQIGRYETLELVFTSTNLPPNPFDTYLLKLELTDPNGRIMTIDGFYDGDGNGGQSGRVWKARISPDEVGIWSWRTVPGDGGTVDSGLANLSGQFDVVDTGEIGGIVADGRYFRFQNGDYIYLIGNFLDFTDGLKTTHTFMSEVISDPMRDLIIDRQCNFHAANKANIYFANKGDYNNQSVTPWVGSANSNDKTIMDVTRWNDYDNHILRFKENYMLAEMWFFADDSNFGTLSESEQNRLFRYAMARTSAFSHVMYVIALEWQEGFSVQKINDAGDFLQENNPWNRLLSVHSVESSIWEYSGQSWATFIASQAGNRANPDEVNAYAIQMRNSDTIPHLGEEFGMLRNDSDTRLRGNLWANFTGGAAGGGTGSDLKALQSFLFFSKVPFQRMEPANHLVEDGGGSRFVLAEMDHHYVVYSSGGGFELDVSGSDLTAYWFDPRRPGGVLSSPLPVGTGLQQFTPPDNIDEDWVLWITDGSNLNGGVAQSQVRLSTRSSSVLLSENLVYLPLIMKPSPLPSC